ncbi:phosphoesterase [Mycoplasmatota bacterium WC44]
MKYAYDLHIHSVLSPCADELMTPNNILNMAMLNELDFIAVTDHNSLKQLDVINEIAESYDFILIPGVEVQVNGGHILCYFTDFDSAHEFDLFLERYIIKKDIECEQFLMDVYDSVIGQVPYYLISDVKVSFEDILKKVKQLNGITVLSHLDRPSYSALHFINEDNIDLFDGIELSKLCDAQVFLKQNPLIRNKPLFINSDSHQIVSLSLRENFIELKEKSIEAFFDYFGAS